MAIDPAVVALRKRTGAPVRDCLAARRETGDEDRATAALARAAVAQIVSAVGCPREHAEAAHARFGWNLERACTEARRTWFIAEPAAEIADVRSWRIETHREASRFGELLPLVYQANIASSPLGEGITALSGLEIVLGQVRRWPEDWELYWDNRWGMRDAVITALKRNEAPELLAVLENGKWTTAVDAAAALVHVPALFERVKAAVASVLEIRPADG